MVCKPVNHVNVIRGRIEPDAHCLGNAGRGFRRRGYPEPFTFGLPLHAIIVWVVGPRQGFGRVPQAVPSIQPPLIPPCPADVARELGELVGATDESEPDDPGADLGSHYDFDIPISQAKVLFPTTV